MKPSGIVGFIFVICIIIFLLWGLYYHQPICYKECEAAEVRYEKEIGVEYGVLREMEQTCSEACYKFLFDGKEIWFFNWRIK